MQTKVNTWQNPVTGRIITRGVVVTTAARVQPVLRAIGPTPEGYKRTIKKMRTNKAGTLAYVLVWDDPVPLSAPVAA